MVHGHLALMRGVAAACALTGIVIAAPLMPVCLLTIAGRIALAVAAAYFTWAFVLCLPMPKVSNIEQRAVLVTGCSSGIGYHTALALDKLGAPVIAACRNPQKAGVLELQQKASSKLRVVKMDVVCEKSVAGAVEEVRAILGENKLWAIVNNAGALGVGEAEWMDMDEVQAIFDINTLGELRVARAFLPLLRESRGRIINMASILCNVCVFGIAPYTMSKYATLAFTQCMKQEMRKFGISVHSIEPWFYQTPLVESGNTKLEEGWSKVPQSVKDAYGKNYIRRLQGTSDTMLNLITYPSKRLTEVADTIVDACFSQHPQGRYIPCFLGKTSAFLIRNFPWIIDIAHIIMAPKIKNK